MEYTLVTILKDNKIIGNNFFKNIEDGEKNFAFECLKLDKALEEEDIPDLLDDGYFVFDDITVCINSFHHSIEPTHGVIFVANNCIDSVQLHYNYYELKRSFQEILQEHSSNGDEYTSEDIDQLMSIGCENINGWNVYYFRLKKQ